MKISIDYENEQYTIVWTDSIESLNYDAILGSRPLVHCWMLGTNAGEWIRILQINDLATSLMSNFVDNKLVKLRFSSSNVSPNITSQLTLINQCSAHNQLDVVVSPFGPIAQEKVPSKLVEDWLEELHGNKDLWMRVKCFAYDLRRFDSPAQQRLESYGGQYYMNERYFSPQELCYLLSFPTTAGGDTTAQGSLETLFISKSENGGTVICTSHDIAPLVEKLYGIRKNFEKERDFKAYFKRFASKERAH